MSAANMAGAPSGYYRRLDGRTTQYWSGEAWLEHYSTPDAAIGTEPPLRAPAPPTAPAPAPQAPPTAPARQLPVGAPAPSSRPAGAPIPRPAPAPAPYRGPGPAAGRPPRGSSRPRGRGEVWIVTICLALTLLGLGNNYVAFALGLLLEALTIALIVLTARRRRPRWLWGLVPVLVLRGPLPIGAVTYVNQGVSLTFGVLTAAFFLLMLAGPVVVRRRG